jgi:hypothetical protein
MFEFAYNYSDAERKTIGLFDKLLEHLVKIYLINDKRLNKYHIGEISVFINDILDVLSKTKGKIKRSKLEKWYFIDELDNTIENLITKVHNDYEFYPIRNYNYVKKKVKNIINDLLDCFVKRNRKCCLDVLKQIAIDVGVKID